MRSDRTRGLMDNVDTELMRGVGIHLRAREYDRMIVRHGNTGEYRKHVRCPCIRDGSRTAKADCEHCHGTGRLWPEEMRIPGMYALDIGRQATLTMATAGTWSEGTIQITFPSALEPAMGDQWLPEGEEMTVEETFQRDGNLQTEREILRPWMTLDSRPRAEVVGPARLKYERPCCFEHVTYVDPDTGALAVAQPYQYHVDDNRVWTWRVGGPRSGDFWTVRYRAPAVYQIHTAVPRFRSEADQRMPYLCTALRLDKLTAGIEGDIRT